MALCITGSRTRTSSRTSGGTGRHDGHDERDGQDALKPRAIAAFAIAGIGAHLWLRWASDVSPTVVNAPLLLVLALGGVPLVVSLIRKAIHRQFGSDLLAGI